MVNPLFFLSMYILVSNIEVMEFTKISFIDKAYSHQSMFWSDLGPEIGFEGVGIIDSSLPTVAIYAKAQEENSQNEEAEKVRFHIFYDIFPTFI